MTPSIAFVQAKNPHGRGIKLWIPLFLLWIPLILLSPLILLLLAIACLLCRISLLRAIAVFWNLSCSLPGTQVDVRGESSKVMVRIL